MLQENSNEYYQKLKKEFLIETAINLSKRWFNINLYDYQKEIVYTTLDKDIRLVTIRATTGAGKSYALSVSALLFAILYPNSKIGVIGPTEKQSKIIFTTIAEILSSSDKMAQIVDIDVMGLTKLEKLKTEVSKKKVTFKNGSYIEILTADVNKEGAGLLGFGYNLVLVDETELIPDNVYTLIMRMYARTKGAKIIEIGNPINLEHFYAHHNDDDWYKLHIKWQDCVKVGQMNKDDIMKLKKDFTDLEFTVLYNAEFPSNTENCAIPKEYIDLACRKKEFKNYDSINIGVDVARGGKDYSVITVLGYKDKEISFIEHKIVDKRDVMVVVGEVRLIADKYKEPNISVDTVGLGGGVYDRLKELRYYVKEFIAGAKSKSDRYYNYKTETLFNLRELFRNGQFYNLPENSKYVLQLRQYELEPKSDKSIKVVDPENKSPDEADSLIMAIAIPRQIKLGILNI